jgi:hypothetical protein
VRLCRSYFGLNCFSHFPYLRRPRSFENNIISSVVDTCSDVHRIIVVLFRGRACSPRNRP